MNNSEMTTDEITNYEDCLECIRDISNTSIFLAYNVNVDAIKFFKKGNDIQNLINQFSSEDILNKIKEYPRIITNPLDFIARLIYSMKTGKPSEVPTIEDKSLEEWFNKLKYDEERMGGQAGIIANISYAF